MHIHADQPAPTNNGPFDFRAKQSWRLSTAAVRHLGQIMRTTWMLSLVFAFWGSQLAPLTDLTVLAVKTFALCTAFALLGSRSYVLAAFAFAFAAVLYLPHGAPQLQLDNDTAYSIMVVSGLFALCTGAVSWLMKHQQDAGASTESTPIARMVAAGSIELALQARVAELQHENRFLRFAASKSDAAVAAIMFAQTTDHAPQFLNRWIHGDWDIIRREWPECPEEVFVDASAIATDDIATGAAR
jgi:hypothetical protein